MRKISQALLLSLCAVAALTTLGACYDEGADSATRGSDGTIEVRLTIQTRAAQTLADGADTTEYYESYVDIPGGDYRIYFFSCASGDSASGGGTLIAAFTPVDVTMTADGTTYTNYTITGRVSDDVADYDSFRVVVLANWQHYPTGTLGTTTLDELVASSASTFTMPADFLPTATSLIPFYGVAEYSGVEWSVVDNVPTGAALSGAITLLRAMAKVEVVTDGTITFTTMTVHNCNTTGYCAPTGVYTAKACEEYSYTSPLHLYGGANSNDAHLPMTLTATDETTGAQTWTVYLAEHDNMGYPFDSTCSYIATTREGYNDANILFGEYSNYTCDAYNTSATTGRFNIARNCYYSFTVTNTDTYTPSADPGISNNVNAPTQHNNKIDITMQQKEW